MTDEKLKSLIECLPDGLHIEHPITADSTFLLMGMDSLDFIEFLGKVEEQFDAKIPNKEARNFHAIADVGQWLESQGC